VKERVGGRVEMMNRKEFKAWGTMGQIFCGYKGERVLEPGKEKRLEFLSRLGTQGNALTFHKRKMWQRKNNYQGQKTNFRWEDNWESLCTPRGDTKRGGEFQFKKT